MTLYVNEKHTHIKCNTLVYKIFKTCIKVYKISKKNVQKCTMYIKKKFTKINFINNLFYLPYI